jgi:hypothetical protein
MTRGYPSETNEVVTEDRMVEMAVQSLVANAKALVFVFSLLRVGVLSKKSGGRRDADPLRVCEP